MTKGDRERVKERERKWIRAEPLKKNNGIEVKFRFGAIVQICLFVRKTKRTEKFRIEQK